MTISGSFPNVHPDHHVVGGGNDAGICQGSLAPTPSLCVKNTFIDDWPDLPPSPLQLQKHESCPAALAPGSLAESLAKAACDMGETSPGSPSFLRISGEALEVNLDEASQVGHARLRAASQLGVSPRHVRLVDCAGQCIEDDVFVCELWTEGLRLDVADAAEIRRQELSMALQRALERGGADTGHIESLNFLKICTAEDFAFAIKFLLSCALQDMHQIEHCADVMLGLCRRHPSFEPDDDASTKATSSTRIVRYICQEEYELLMCGVSAQTQQAYSDTRLREQGARPEHFANFINFLTKLYARGLLVPKVLVHVLSDVLWPGESPPDSVPLRCACQIIEVLAASSQSTSKKESRFLSEALQRLDTLEKSITEAEGRPVYSGDLRLRMEGILYMYAGRLRDHHVQKHIHER